MDDLIAALQILNEYIKEENKAHPTHCEHDVLYVLVSPLHISGNVLNKLEDLGFSPNYEEEHFYSYRFGSA